MTEVHCVGCAQSWAPGKVHTVAYVPTQGAAPKWAPTLLVQLASWHGSPKSAFSGLPDHAYPILVELGKPGLSSVLGRLKTRSHGSLSPSSQLPRPTGNGDVGAWKLQPRLSWGAGREVGCLGAQGPATAGSQLSRNHQAGCQEQEKPSSCLPREEVNPPAPQRATW